MEIEHLSDFVSKQTDAIEDILHDYHKEIIPLEETAGFSLSDSSVNPDCTSTKQ